MMIELATREWVDTAEVAALAKREGIGALVVGGDHPSLGVARSWAKLGIPVYMVEDQPRSSVYSRFAKRVVRVKDVRDQQKTVDAVLDVGHQFGLRNWVLFPTRDENVAAFSAHRDRLAEFFRVLHHAGIR